MDETPTNTNAAPASEAAAPAPAPAGEKKSHTGLIVGIIIAVVLIVAGAITCVLLLTNNNKDNNGGNGGGTGQDGGNGGNDGGDNGGGNSGKATKTVSCTAGGDTWKYGLDIEVDEEALKSKTLGYSLYTSDDFDSDELDSIESLVVSAMAMAFSEFMEMDDPGVTLNVTEGDFATTGAGFDGTAKVVRSKAKADELEELFTEYDDMTADEILEMMEEEAEDSGLNGSCKIK